jgi:hypothetical protein
VTSAFRGAEPLLAMLAAGVLPEPTLDAAAKGTLTLPFGSKLWLLVTLATRPGPMQATARETIEHVDRELMAGAIHDEDCPPEVRTFCQELLDEEERERELIAAAAKQAGSFELQNATPEEQSALAAGEKAKPESQSLLERVSKMSVPQRVQLALRGSRDERLLLVRDSNKIVQRAVVTSPRLSESDAEMIAGLRTVTDEVLRNLAQDRRFLKSTAVVRALVKNPRTPLDIGLTLLKLLPAGDVKGVATSRDVNETLRRMAAKVLAQKMQGR